MGVELDIAKAKKLAPHTLVILSVAGSVYMEDGMLKGQPPTATKKQTVKRQLEKAKKLLSGLLAAGIHAILEVPRQRIRARRRGGRNHRPL